jgi:zinc transporter 1
MYEGRVFFKFKVANSDFPMQIAKRRSRSNTFGWVRAEILGALVNAVFLIALCFTIFVEAIKRLVEVVQL